MFQIVFLQNFHRLWIIVVFYENISNRVFGTSQIASLKFPISTVKTSAEIKGDATEPIFIDNFIIFEIKSRLTISETKSQLIGSSSCLILKILVKNAAGRVLYIYELTNAWDLKYFPLLNKKVIKVWAL